MVVKRRFAKVTWASRARRTVVCLPVLLTAFGCGDGIGNPIRSGESGAPDAGVPDAALDSGIIRTDSGGDLDAGGVIGLDPATEVVPATRHCKPAAILPADTRLEDNELWALIMAIRSGYLPCGSRGAAPASALHLTPELNCSARLHALDMADRGFFDQQNPDGEYPEDRIAQAGYTFSVAGEVIAHGSFEEISQQIANSNRNCSLLLDPAFQAVGIGHLDNLWVIDLAGP